MVGGKWFSCAGVTPKNSTIKYYFYTSCFLDRLGLIVDSPNLKVSSKFLFLGNIPYLMSRIFGSLEQNKRGIRLYDITNKMKLVLAIENVRTFLNTLKENNYETDDLFREFDKVVAKIRDNPSPTTYDGTPALLSAMVFDKKTSIALKLLLGIMLVPLLIIAGWIIFFMYI
jgi:hypothetical protein